MKRGVLGKQRTGARWLNFLCCAVLSVLLAAPALAADDSASEAAAKVDVPVVPPEGQVPAAFLLLPEEIRRGVVVDVDTNRLLVVERSSEGVEIVQDHYVAIGKAGADKRVEGDEKTPIGVYYVTRYIDGRELPPIYGAGALPVNYPNAWDRRLERTGSGIWLHGTDKDDATLMPRSSRGCLTVLDDDFEAIRLGAAIGDMPVIVGHGINWATPGQLQQKRQAVLAAIEQWRLDWESRDPARYLRHYASDFASDGMSRRRWAEHKSRVNPSKRYIEIGLGKLALYSYPGEPGLVVASFRQDYRSDNYSRSRMKHQYWRLEDGSWKIVWEGKP